MHLILTTSLSSPLSILSQVTLCQCPPPTGHDRVANATGSSPRDVEMVSLGEDSGVNREEAGEGQDDGDASPQPDPLTEVGLLSGWCMETLVYGNKCIVCVYACVIARSSTESDAN